MGAAGASPRALRAVIPEWERWDNLGAGIPGRRYQTRTGEGKDNNQHRRNSHSYPFPKINAAGICYVRKLRIIIIRLVPPRMEGNAKGNLLGNHETARSSLCTDTYPN